VDRRQVRRPRRKRVATALTTGLLSDLVEIRELTEADLADDTLADEIYDVAERAIRLGREQMPFMTRQALIGHLRSKDSGERATHLVAYDGERIVGWSTLYEFLLDNTDKAFVETAVDPAARRAGVGRALVAEAESRAKAGGRTLLLGETKVPPGERDSHGNRRFADALGFEFSNVEVVRHLPLPLADQRLEAWAAEAAAKAGGYTIEVLVDELPDDLVESLGLLMGQLAVDAPTGAVDFEEELMTPERLRERQETVTAMGRSLYEAVALTPDRQVVAHSTLAVPVDAAATDAYQWGTLVHRDHRGHRLGLATKVANLRAVQAAHPGLRRVTTQNAESNDYMVSINEKLGFAKVEESVEFLKRI
jgi:GNAT superfamily N-acetyltransferase/RimJ/RimL family protein N-acetyltransferase